MTDPKHPDPPLRSILNECDDAVELLFDALPGWAWETDADHRFTYFSDGCVRHSGQTTQNIGKSRMDILRGISAHSDATRRHLDDLANLRPFDNFAFRQSYSEQKNSWVCTSGRPRHAPDGTFLGYQGIALVLDSMMDAARLSLDSENELLRRNAELEAHVARHTRELEQSNRLLAEVLAGMRQGLLVLSPGGPADQTIEVSNAKTADMLGVDAPLVARGAPFAALLDALAAVRDAPPSFDLLTNTHQLADGRVIRGEAMPRDAGGQILTFTDVTDLVEQQEALTEAHLLMQEVLEGMDQGLVVYEGATPDQHRVVLANRRAAEVLEVPADTIAPGMSQMDFIRASTELGHYDNGALNAMERIASAFSRRETITATRELPSGRVLRALGRWRDEGGMIVTLTDITDLRDRERELDQARQSAESANHAKSLFLANMSHELRTPMNGILGMAQMLAESGLQAEQRLCLTTIEQSCDALLKILNDILDFSKIEAGKLEIHREPLDLGAVTHDTAALLAPVAAAKDVDLCIDIEPGLTITRIGDAGRLRQTLLNLAGNAVKFTEMGHVLIRLQAGPGTDIVRFDVEDTGVGIPEDKIDTIFAEFEQVDNAATRKFTGTGLGLAITRKLVALMGGTVSVRSEDRLGSTFTVDLPLPVDTGCVAEPRLDLTGRRILVAMPDPMTRGILCRDLAHLGAEPVSAARSGEVLSLLRAAKTGDRFDAVIGDNNLPGLSGAGLLEQLETAPDLPRTPLAICVQADQSAALIQLTGPLFAGVLFKPVRLAHLTELMSRVLSGQLERAAPSTAAVTAAPLAGRRILIAEDNRTNQLVIRKFLEPAKAVIVICGDGQAVIDAYRSDGADVILMDVSMPVKSGLCATREIRELEIAENRARCPIIALTANAMPQDRDRCLAAGMDDFVPKPVRKALLLARIEALLATGEASDVA